MTPEEAIKIIKEDLEHTRSHLQDKNKAPEFYEEMKSWEKAEELAIKALKIIDCQYIKDECDNCGGCENEWTKEEPPVATSRHVQQETEIERDITKLESRMARIEEMALNILTGSTVRSTGELNIHLSHAQREFIYETWREINAEMHGKPEETGDK